MKTKQVQITLGLAFLVIVAVLSCSKSKHGSGEVTPVDTTKVSEKTVIDTLPPSTPMKHVGALHTPADFARIKLKLANHAEPWTSGYNKLINNVSAQTTYVANPTEKLIRGGRTVWEPEPDNYSRAMNDVAAAYQLALRWKITGDSTYAQTAINILNAWARTCKVIAGDTNAALAAGLYGYQFAIAGELLRDYSGWKTEDFVAYQKWMIDVFYSANMSFLKEHFGTCYTHYWANWDLANLSSVLAIGILTDERSIYNYAVDYLQRGKGNGNWFHAINYVFDGENEGLAQLQESGRDQGHATLVISLLGVIAQLTWNQGDDFYGLDDNRFLKACEYTAKYNVAHLEVPFHEYIRYYGHNCDSETYTAISDASRGISRPMWTAPYFHYTRIENMKAPYTLMGVNQTSPEGGGRDYGTTSGAFDQLGFGTLMYTVD
ncbi:MAG TPA: alginate lyase family protein [Pelobium sp.]|nr:alginate lyase family protein [Pelobium sp.]